MVLGREIGSCTHAKDVQRSTRWYLRSTPQRMPASLLFRGWIMRRNDSDFETLLLHSSRSGSVVALLGILDPASWLHLSVPSRHTSTQERKSKERGQRVCIRVAVVNHKPFQPPCSVVVDTRCVQLVRKKGRFLMRGRRLGQITKLSRLGCHAAHSRPSCCSPALTQSN